MTRAILLAAVGLSNAAALSAQLPPVPSPPLRDAYYAMSDGRYLEGLTQYLEIVEAARDTALLAEIAIQTGELHPVVELTDDGRGIVLGPGGNLLAAYVGQGSDQRLALWRVDRTDEGWLSATARDPIHGSRAAVWDGPGGAERIAYLTAGDTDAIETARLQMERARERRSGLEFQASRRLMEWLQVSTAEVRIRSSAGVETAVQLDGRIPVDWRFADDGSLWLLASTAQAGETGLFRVEDGGGLARVDRHAGYKEELQIAAGSRFAVVRMPASDPAMREPGSAPSPSGEDTGVVAIDLETGEPTIFQGADAALSSDGTTLAFLKRPDGFQPDRIRFPHGPGGEIHAVRLGGTDSRRVWSTDAPLRDLALSPDGRWVAYSHRPDRDWEAFVRPVEGSERPRRVTDEIQHDLGPRFIDRGTMLATKGESRHRRAYVYGLAGGPPLKLFDNNVLRTITPEYEWSVSPSGDWVAVVAERDGDTVSPERGLYLVDLTRRVGREDLRDRIQLNIDRERELEALGAERFGHLEDSVRTRTQDVSESRIHEYERALHAFGSKFVTEPGNRRARDYLIGALRSFGYTPEVQEFEALPGVMSANVVATLAGGEDADLVYVISSHFDSSNRGPGADDNTSGTAVLLETARVLARHPQRATIQFAFLTGEEAGLLGAREYVRRAQASGLAVVGVLNNDMVGWTNDHRLDNTIRYSSDGIRDVQHAAASRYSDLITYDAKYYKNTDAHAFFDAYGDIVGGIGSYPVLGNPNYHQATDRIETVNHQLVTEVARTTVATVMALAFGPSRPAGLTAQTLSEGGIRLSWSAGETAVRSYGFRYRATPTDPWTTSESGAPSAELPELPDGAEIEVWSVTREGVTSWDRARLVVGAEPGTPGRGPGR